MDLHVRLEAKRRTDQISQRANTKPPICPLKKVRNTLCNASHTEGRKAAQTIFLKYCGMTSILAQAYAGKNFGYK